MREYFTRSDIAEADRLLHLAHRKELAHPFGEAYPRLRDLTTVEIGILRSLAEDPELKPTEIARGMDISKSTLTSAINRLEKRGYLERRISLTDRRSFRLALSKEGLSAQEEHLAAEKAFYERLLGLLDGEDEVATFLSLMAKVIEGF
jgi:DNA-binding MarR family transcriptional regulator